MKGNKKILALALLLLLIGISFGTYAIYKSSASGTATVETAAWVVKVNTADIVTTDSFTFGADDVDWTTGNVQSQVPGKIAPGDSGTITIAIDASGSEVDVDYEVVIGTVTDGTNNVSNNNFSVAFASGDGTGTIDYDNNGTPVEVTLNVTWTAADNAAANTADVALAGKTIEIPVTVTATQHLY